MTLVEVVAATLLLGTLVTASLTAHAQCVAAVKTAERRLISTEIARDLLATWELEEVDLSGEASGGVDGHPHWFWLRRAVAQEVADDVSATVVTLTLERRDSSGAGPRWQRSFRWIARDGGRTLD